MSKYEAKKLCPEIILVVGNNRKYTYTCAQLADIYKRYTPLVEVYSVDEAFLDVTDTKHLFGGTLRIGREIKKEIRKLFGINATIGISQNKLLAKLAADISKPDGLRWIRTEDVQPVLEDLPADELWGIGKGIAHRLHGMGIKTIKLNEAIRLLGTSISGIIEDTGQMPIFNEYRRRYSLIEAMDQINNRYGEFTLSWASYTAQDSQSGVISPAWRPSGVHKTIV